MIAKTTSNKLHPFNTHKAIDQAERYSSDKNTIVDVEKLALTLHEKERATLAADLLESLAGVLSDEDEGIAEALPRYAELEANPDRAILLRNWMLKQIAGAADASGIPQTGCL